MELTIASATDLKHFSDELLDQSLLTYVRKEKEVLKEILCHIAEIDRRRLYLTLGYSSLYAYLTERMGYDGGSAQRRLDAVRLSLVVPSVLEQIDQGEITLSQVTFLQKSLRQVKEQKISSEAKAEILESIKNKSLEQTQVHISKALQIETKELAKVKHQADESVRLEVTLTKEQWEKLKTMRELLSNSLPDGGWDQVLEYVATKVIAQKTKGAARVSANPSSSATTLSSTKPEARSAPRSLSQSLQREILRRDQCCQYRSKITGKLCGSKWNLEVDHIQPRWAHGTNILGNLRVLCVNHNKEIYRQQARIRQVHVQLELPPSGSNAWTWSLKNVHADAT